MFNIDSKSYIRKTSSSNLAEAKFVKFRFEKVDESTVFSLPKQSESVLQASACWNRQFNPALASAGHEGVPVIPKKKQLFYLIPEFLQHISKMNQCELSIEGGVFEKKKHQAWQNPATYHFDRKWLGKKLAIGSY